MSQIGYRTYFYSRVIPFYTFYISFCKKKSWNLSQSKYPIVLTSYNNSIKATVDKHAPLIKKTITVKHHKKKMSESVRQEKSKTRKMEKEWRTSKDPVKRVEYVTQKRLYNSMLDIEEKNSISSIVLVNQNNPRDLFSTLSGFMGKKSQSPLPPHDSPLELANGFVHYYHDKIKAIQIQLNEEIKASNLTRGHETPKFTTILIAFEEMSMDRVRKLVMGPPPKTCILDPLPTWLLKLCIDEVLPVITEMVNLSLTQGTMPQDLKLAVLFPKLKQPLIDLIFKNYRPLSNIAFVSKTIERAACVQIIHHMRENGLFDKFQSAYTEERSTETALLRVQSDTCMNMDNGFLTFIFMIDLSSAFDTVNHEILIERVSERLGIRGTALKWIISYLTGRTQVVNINGTLSEEMPLDTGVPQGSVMGGILFLIYTLPLRDILQGHGFNYHLYADD